MGKMLKFIWFMSFPFIMYFSSPLGIAVEFASRSQNGAPMATGSVATAEMAQRNWNYPLSLADFQRLRQQPALL